jgi:transposase-like protein
MTNDMNVPYLAPGESAKARSAEADSAGAGAPPDPEVAAKPKRRQFTAAYRLRILEEAGRCTTSGEIGQLLRREGLYSSHLSNWRKAQREGSLAALAPKKRGAKAKVTNPLEPKVRELESKVARLEKELHKAHTILDVQEKVAGLLGFDLESGKNS